MGRNKTLGKVHMGKDTLKMVGRRTGPAVAGLFVIVAMLCSCAAAFAAGDANQSGCPSSTESSPGFRTYLPDCRAYELVTPPYKEGAVVLQGPAAISSDGEHVIVGVPGTFAGEDNQWLQLNANPDIAVYELSRSESGWQTSALTPPATRYPYSAIHAASVSDNLATTLWSATASTLLFKEDLYLRGPEGSFVPVGPGYGPEVANQELSTPSDEAPVRGWIQRLESPALCDQLRRASRRAQRSLARRCNKQ